MRHLFIAGSLVIILAFTAGCGSDESATETTPTDTTPTETTSTTPTESPAAAGSQTPSTQPAEPEGTVIEVTLAGGEVTPSGERVEAVIGEPITLSSTPTHPVSCTSTPQPAPRSRSKPAPPSTRS